MTMVLLCSVSQNGASGLLSASQVCSGAVNGLKIEIYGDKASIHWAQEEPNSMTIKTRGAPDQVCYIRERISPTCHLRPSLFAARPAGIPKVT